MRASQEKKGMNLLLTKFVRQKNLILSSTKFSQSSCMHFAQWVCQYWKPCLEPISDIIFRMAIKELRHQPCGSKFRQGNRNKSHRARSGLYEGCDTHLLFVGSKIGPFPILPNVIGKVRAYIYHGIGAYNMDAAQDVFSQHLQNLYVILPSHYHMLRVRHLMLANHSMVVK